MTNNNAQQSKLNRLLATSDYNEVRVYLKQTSYIKSNKDSKLFWQSTLPITWFNQISKEPFLEELLFNYFRKQTLPNEAFLKQFFNSNKKPTLIKIIKLSEAFNHVSHWESFSVFQNDSQLKVFYKELQYIKSYRGYWEEEEKEHNAFIKSMALEDILFQMTMCYEDFKQHSGKATGNRSKRVSYEAILINLLNTFLKIKKEDLKQKGLKVDNQYDVNYFKTIPVEEYQVLKNKFREVVEFYFAKYDGEYQIKKYLSSFAEFEYIDDLESVLLTNKEHSLYRKTLERGMYDETYLTNRVVNNKEQLKKIKALPEFWDRQFELDILSSIEYFNFLNIPAQISIKKENASIDLSKVLYLLKSFSLFFMLQPSIGIVDKFISQQVPKRFKDLFYSDYIVCYEKDDFINKCVTYFKYSMEEIINILNFITLDLNDDISSNLDIKQNPLIKIGNQYVWMSSFMKDRRWEIALHSKMVKDDLINQNKVSGQSEIYLSNIFKEANFNAISGQRYKYNNKSGEIDLLAYKDGVLFIGELKSTYVIEDMIKNSKYEARQFNKASEQLDLAKDYVLNNFEDIRNLEELNIDCPLEDLKIETVIVSNIYQGDHIMVNNKHLKVSLFELLIILKDDLYNMLVPKMGEALFDYKLEIPLDMMLNMFNRNNSNNKENNNTLSKEECSLWENEKDCSPNDVISAIIENKVWKHQDTNKNFPIEEVELTTYNKQSKYLS
jgi:hypothetical protein